MPGQPMGVNQVRSLLWALNIFASKEMLLVCAAGHDCEYSFFSRQAFGVAAIPDQPANQAGVEFFVLATLLVAILLPVVVAADHYDDVYANDHHDHGDYDDAFHVDDNDADDDTTCEPDETDATAHDVAAQLLTCVAGVASEACDEATAYLCSGRRSFEFGQLMDG